MTSLDSLPLNHVLDAKTAKEVWDLLRVCYQGDDDLRQHYLLKRLFTTAFCDSDPMELQIADIVAITRQLTDIGFPILDHISKKEPACTCTYYALPAPVMTGKAFIRKFSVRSVSQVKVLQ